MYACGDLNTLMLQWSTLETEPFSFAKATVTSSHYLDMLENSVYPQLRELQHAMFIQKNVTTPHWSLIRASRNQHFPNQWIGHASSISCPARSLDIMPCNFLLWGYVEDWVPNFSDLHQWFKEQNSSYCWSTRHWHAAAHMDRAWILLGLCVCVWQIGAAHTQYVYCSEQTLRVSNTDDAQCVHVFSYSFYSWVKLYR
jgi:hypothetical protein